jgi:hypothetical protein
MDREFKAALKEAKQESVSIVSSEVDAVDTISDILFLSQSTRDELERRQHKTKSRKTWGRVLLAMVVCGFTASYLIIIAIGLNWLTYTDSQFAVPSVIAAGIVGTYGLAKIAVNYFFTD